MVCDPVTLGRAALARLACATLFATACACCARSTHPGAAVPQGEHRRQPVQKADGGPDAAGLDADAAGPAPEHVSIERLISEPASYIGKHVTTVGWVVPCDAMTACGITCSRGAMCSTRAVFVPAGTPGVAPCEGNRQSLIIMNPRLLNRYWCRPSSCDESRVPPCPFPVGTAVRLAGTIELATTSQIDVAHEQYVFVPDAKPPPEEPRK